MASELQDIGIYIVGGNNNVSLTCQVSSYRSSSSLYGIASINGNGGNIRRITGIREGYRIAPIDQNCR